MVKPFVTAVLLFFLVPVLSSGAENEGAPASAYSDEDIQGYSDRSDAASFSVTGEKNQKGKRKTTAKQKDDKQLWCKEGTRHRTKVEKAKNEVSGAEREFGEKEYEYYRGKISSRQYAAARKDLEKARDKLKEAEQSLIDLENEAHRNWIPPGWLRCQFE